MQVKYLFTWVNVFVELYIRTKVIRKSKYGMKEIQSLGGFKMKKPLLYFSDVSDV